MTTATATAGPTRENASFAPRPSCSPPAGSRVPASPRFAKPLACCRVRSTGSSAARRSCWRPCSRTRRRAGSSRPAIPSSAQRTVRRHQPVSGSATRWTTSLTPWQSGRNSTGCCSSSPSNEGTRARRRFKSSATSGNSPAGPCRPLPRNRIVDERTPEEAVADLTRASLAFFDGALVAAQIDPAKADLRRMFALLRAGVIAAMPEMSGAGGDPP